MIAQIREDNRSAQNQDMNPTTSSMIINHKTGRTEIVFGAKPMGAYIQVIRGMIVDDEAEALAEDTAQAQGKY
ncbi:hypothetical protein [Vreelandella sulfidaeris]